MSEKPRLFVTVLVVIVGLLGLGMTLCGGIFTFAAIPDILSKRGGENFAPAILVISVPSLVVGAVLLWLARKRWVALSTSTDEGP